MSDPPTLLEDGGAVPLAECPPSAFAPPAPHRDPLRGALAGASERHVTDPASSILDLVTDGYIVLEADGRCAYVNRSAERMIGHPARDLIGTRIWSLFPELDGQHPFRAACDRAMRDQAPTTIEGQNEPTALWIRCRIFPEPDRLTLVLSDVTEYHVGLRKLRDVEERYRQLTDNIEQVFWLISVPSGEMIYLSPNAPSICGSTSPSSLCDPRESLSSVHPDDAAALIDSFEKAMTGEQTVAEYRFHGAGEPERWMRSRYFPVRDETGSVVRLAGTTEDVSDRKVLQAQLAQAQKLEAIGRLAGGVAHDFNNQLTAILGFSRLLESEIPVESEHGEYVAEILKAAERSAKLTNKLLAFSRRQVMQPQVLQIGKVVADVDLMLRRLIEKNIELVILPGTTTGTVRADPMQLEQVLVNLVVNSRDAMPDGGRILIHVLDRRVDKPLVRSHGVIPPGDYVVLAVSDDGCGMDEATLARIFEPFFTTKPPDKGTGLGMPMVLGIVEQSGGHIAIISRPNGGTTIKIYLPVVADAPAEPSAAIAPHPPSGDGTILLAEDEPAVRALTRAMLLRAGYTVLESENGEQALRVWNARTQEIDLVVTDLTMPLMGGKELARRLAAEGSSVPIVFISGYSDDLAFGDVGGPTAEFLAKPFSPDELVEKVERVLANSRKQR
jgi:two-component system, cell cycle sensor histidine kinase and response regulator CckA